MKDPYYVYIQTITERLRAGGQDINRAKSNYKNHLGTDTLMRCLERHLQVACVLIPRLKSAVVGRLHLKQCRLQRRDITPSNCTLSHFCRRSEIPMTPEAGLPATQTASMLGHQKSPFQPHSDTSEAQRACISLRYCAPLCPRLVQSVFALRRLRTELDHLYLHLRAGLRAQFPSVRRRDPNLRRWVIQLCPDQLYAKLSILFQAHDKAPLHLISVHFLLLGPPTKTARCDTTAFPATVERIPLARSFGTGKADAGGWSLAPVDTSPSCHLF